MNRVIEELARVRESADADAVHDLRVAIRRCRSVGTIMEEVNDHRTWESVRRLPRKLFRALGTLRDLDVLAAWVERLVAADDPLRSKLLELLDEGARTPRRRVRRAIRTFDEKSWQRLAHSAPKRARLVPPNSLTAQCLALERWEDLDRLHAYAMHDDSPGTWHALRIGLKRFRYVIEILLPGRSEAWSDGLGQTQDLLGEIHDLDVLRTRVTRHLDGIDAMSTRAVRHAIATKRRECVERYGQLMTGDASLLRTWRAGLPAGKAIAAAGAGRLRTTMRAMDPHPRRAAAVARLAVALFDGVKMTSSAGQWIRDDRFRTILGAAALLHGIHANRWRASRHKAASHFLRQVPVPPGWSAHDWALLTVIVRYHRGAEPVARHRRFAQFSREDQEAVRYLAGVIRLARGLRRCGVNAPDNVGVDTTAASVQLRVLGLPDTAKNAARLAAAKHLLEASLQRPILIELTTVATSVRPTRLAIA
jgi:CHAD domain-containing protein